MLDRVTGGPKPGLVRRLGATYHHRDIDSVAKELRPDVVIEATGAGSVVFGVLQNTGHYGVTCLTGVSPAGWHIRVDAGAVKPRDRARKRCGGRIGQYDTTARRQIGNTPQAFSMEAMVNTARQLTGSSTKTASERSD